MKPGAITDFRGAYRFLSNFYPCRVADWPSVEHAYQASKSDDPAVWERIRNVSTASEAKRIGRMIHIRADWDAIRVPTMWRLLVLKFSDPTLSYGLAGTAPALLVEGNTWGDTYWGVCNGVGENHLGRLLMALRDGPRAYERRA